MKRVAVINGPNLNLLGTRQPDIYGTMTLTELEEQVADWARNLGIEASFHQSNDESELVSVIQNSGEQCEGILLNAGGFTHTSVAIADAVASVTPPVVEVHLSDINNREPYRQVSLIEPSAVRQISGRGATGYRDALRHLLYRARYPAEPVRYGPHPRNVADYRVSEGRSALIVLVHGGYWFPGWDRDQLDQVAVDLTERGYDTLNVEYRIDPPWPGSGHDVATALSWARQRSKRIVLVGHSAGAYLALWNQSRNPADLCVGLAPVTDLSIVDDVPPAKEIVASGGPRTLAMPGSTVLFHGLDDEEVSPEHTRGCAGDTVVNLLPGVSHFDILNPNRPHWEQIVSTLSDRFNA